jgi:diguanylate cyclase (GGDEF)-like protein
MAFRSRLALLLLVVVSVPLLASGAAFARMARAQSEHDARVALQAASVTAADSLRRERDEVAGALQPSLAVRAFRTRDRVALNALRASSRLDYLLVVKAGRPALLAASLPRTVHLSAEAIDRGGLAAIAAERRVLIRHEAGSSVLGGRLWIAHPAAGLGVRAVQMLDGVPLTSGVGAAPAEAAPAGGERTRCLCHGPRASGVLLITSVAPSSFDRLLHWPRIGLVLLFVGALCVLAYGTAWLLSRPLARLAVNAAALARGEPGVVVVPDQAADREIRQVMDSLHSVSEELHGSRGELARTRGQLVDSERMVLADPLTGVWNRRYLDKTLDEHTKRFARYGRPFALLMIDVDQFKPINDAHGHPAGDAMLRAIAQTIQGSIRADLDVLARFGGEEFVVVLSDTDGSGGLAAAEKIRRLIERSRFDAGGSSVSVTVSVGVSACPRDGTDSERLIHTADAALYQAKRSGRNASVPAWAAGPARAGAPPGIDA